MGFYIRFPNGLKKAVTLSYDDGVRQDRKLLKILNQYGLKCTFNINSGCFEPTAKFDAAEGRMSEEEILAFVKDLPHEIALHGLYHEWDHLLPNNMMADEIIQDRKNLEKLTGKITRGMAYPFGALNDRLVECLKMCGIVYSRTTAASENFNLPEDWLRLNPTCHHSHPRLFELCDAFLNDNPKHALMFYLWGHSYEFDRNTETNSWERIEKFAEKMSGHSDIWYATNIEIYNYTEAFNRLLFSMDGSMVYNPNCIDIWFWKFDACHWGEEKDYCVKAGQTLILD